MQPTAFVSFGERAGKSPRVGDRERCPGPSQGVIGLKSQSQERARGLPFCEGSMNLMNQLATKPSGVNCSPGRAGPVGVMLSCWLDGITSDVATQRGGVQVHPVRALKAKSRG